MQPLMAAWFKSKITSAGSEPVPEVDLGIQGQRPAQGPLIGSECSGMTNEQVSKKSRNNSA